MTKFTPCELTPQQAKLWTDTKAALIWSAPAFTHVFIKMLDRSKYVALFTKDVPIAATDGSALILNPDTFFTYNMYERVFICCHEIMHCILNHLVQMHQWKMQGKVSYSDGKSIPYDHQIMNVAQDLVINSILIDSKIGQYNKNWLHDPKIATAQDLAVDIYRKIYKDQKDGKGVKLVGFDQHLDPGSTQGKDPVTAANERNEVEWKAAVTAGAASARAQGKLPAGLERFFNDILNPQVDWREKIHGLFARRIGTGRYDWQKPDRRLVVRGIIAPGRAGFGAEAVVIGADTSGSIGEKELDMFFAELAGILEDVEPKRLIVMWCDAKVHRIDEANEPGDLNTIRHKGAPGGGGTSFIPVFEEIARMGIEPEAVVYLTDGLGSFPDHAPSYPVIWGNISEPGAVKYPFGDVVDIPSQAA